MEFSKKILILHVVISCCMCVTTIVGTFLGVDVTAVGTLAGASFVTDGAWGGFYFWKAKNENRAKYAQKFVKTLAKEHGMDAAARIADIVLKD